MRKKNREPGESLVICLVMVLGTLILTMLGALTYRSVLDSGDLSAQRRGVQSYLRTQVRNHDTLIETENGTESSVEIRENGRLLVLKEQAGERIFELRIYSEDGYLKEQYVPEGSSDSGSSDILTEETYFFCEIVSGDDSEKPMLHIKTSKGDQWICLFAGTEEQHE